MRYVRQTMRKESYDTESVKGKIILFIMIRLVATWNQSWSLAHSF